MHNECRENTTQSGEHLPGLTMNTGPSADPAQDAVCLDSAGRRRTRRRVRLESGREAAVLLPPGTVMHPGDVLRSEDGLTVLVKAEPENVVLCTARDWRTFARACWHLGNRHAPLEIGELWLRFLPDPVLEKLADSFGLSVTHQTAVFMPEEGAAHSHADGSHA